MAKAIVFKFCTLVALMKSSEVQTTNCPSNGRVRGHGISAVVDVVVRVSVCVCLTGPGSTGRAYNVSAIFHSEAKKISAKAQSLP